MAVKDDSQELLKMDLRLSLIMAVEQDSERRIALRVLEEFLGMLLDLSSKQVIKDWMVLYQVSLRRICSLRAAFTNDWSFREDTRLKNLMQRAMQLINRGKLPVSPHAELLEALLLIPRRYLRCLR